MTTTTPSRRPANATIKRQRLQHQTLGITTIADLDNDDSEAYADIIAADQAIARRQAQEAAQ